MSAILTAEGTEPGTGGLEPHALPTTPCSRSHCTINDPGARKCSNVTAVSSTSSSSVLPAVTSVPPSLRRSSRLAFSASYTAHAFSPLLSRVFCRCPGLCRPLPLFGLSHFFRDFGLCAFFIKCAKCCLLLEYCGCQFLILLNCFHL